MALRDQELRRQRGRYLTDQDLFRTGKLGMVYEREWNIVFPTADLPFNVNTINAGGFPAPASNPSMFGVSYADAIRIRCPQAAAPG